MNAISLEIVDVQLYCVWLLSPVFISSYFRVALFPGSTVAENFHVVTLHAYVSFERIYVIILKGCDWDFATGEREERIGELIKKNKIQC